MEGQAGGAYGAGKAGGDFDPVTFIKKPVTILRILSWVFAIVVFAVASDSKHQDTCWYNGDNSVCGFSIFVGVLAFLACTAFFLADAYFENITSVQQRKLIVMGDLGFSGLWTFFFFVNFCNVASAWSKTVQPKIIEVAGSNPGAIIAFSLFAVITFGGLTYFALLRYRAGVTEPFASANDYAGQAGGLEGGQGGYAPYAGNGAGSDPYQPPPFAGQPGSNTFAAPSY